MGPDAAPELMAAKNPMCKMLHLSPMAASAFDKKEVLTLSGGSVWVQVP